MPLIVILIIIALGLFFIVKPGMVWKFRYWSVMFTHEQYDKNIEPPDMEKVMSRGCGAALLVLAFALLADKYIF